MGGFGTAGGQLIVVVVEIEIKPPLMARAYDLQLGVFHRQLAKADCSAAKVHERETGEGRLTVWGAFRIGWIRREGLYHLVILKSDTHHMPEEAGRGGKLVNIQQQVVSHNLQAARFVRMHHLLGM